MITSADARPGTIRKITVPGRFYTVKTKFKYNINKYTLISEFVVIPSKKTVSLAVMEMKTTLPGHSQLKYHDLNIIKSSGARFTFNEPTKRRGILSYTSTGTAQGFLKGLLS